MPSALVLLAVVLLEAAPSQPGVVVPMTPEAVEDVIVSTDERVPGPYRLRNSHVWLQFDTPRLRLARKVAQTRAQSLPVATHLATPDVVAPELHLVAGPEVAGDSDVGIKAALIERADGTTVEPISLKYNIEKAQSRRRHGIKLKGIEAVFPAEALLPGARFRLKMEDGPDQLLAPEDAWFDEPR